MEKATVNLLNEVQKMISDIESVNKKPNAINVSTINVLKSIEKKLEYDYIPLEHENLIKAYDAGHHDGDVGFYNPSSVLDT